MEFFWVQSVSLSLFEIKRLESAKLGSPLCDIVGSELFKGSEPICARAQRDRRETARGSKLELLAYHCWRF